MTPPPPYSEGPARFLDPDITTTATSLKTLILKRDTTFAKLIVTVILRNLECLKFQTTRPVVWSYTVVFTQRNTNFRMKRILESHWLHRVSMRFSGSERMIGVRDTWRS